MLEQWFDYDREQRAAMVAAYYGNAILESLEVTFR
jgi:hypothetical protein